MTLKAKTLVGLDVHARQTHAAVLDPESGEIAVRRLRVAPGGVAEFLAELGPDVLAVYEAGATGFGLARAGAEWGLDVRVAAPGSIPRAPGDRVKTDRRDAIRLARLLAAGELTFAFVPSVADEHFRDLVRVIEDVRSDLMRARHRLGVFVMRRGERYSGSGNNWQPKHMSWLRALRFEDACSRATFDEYLDAVELLTSRKAALVRALEQQVPRSSHAPMVARLRCFRGVDTLAAAGCAPKSDPSSASQSPTSYQAFSGSCPRSEPPMCAAVRARSRRPVPRTPAACSSRLPTTIASSPRSGSASAGVRRAKTRA